MPLHLLGKKSWNVYNADNIARVRRDEAAARAAEEAEEQRMQEADAQRRLAILRGEAPPPVDEPKTDSEPRHVVRSPYDGGVRRKRKRAGEDDTDFELRLARDRHEAAVGHERQQTNSAPILYRTGHIDLFGDERSRAHAQKNEEAEKEARKKKREYEDQYTMRFSNAAGKDGLARPWYSQQDLTALGEAPSKDVWGNEDPRRKAREAQRLVVDDPLAMMKRGAAKVREVRQERKKLQLERDEELRRSGKEERRREKERNRHERDRHRSPTRRSREEEARRGKGRSHGEGRREHRRRSPAIRSRDDRDRAGESRARREQPL